MSIAKRYAELAGDEANKALQDFLSNDAFDQYAVDLVLDKKVVQLDDQQFEWLLSALADRISSLSSIVLRYHNITDKSLQLLSQQLPLLKSLLTIDVLGCNIVGEAVPDLLNAISSSNVRILILSGNHLDQDVGIKIGEELAYCPLKILEMADCGLTPKALISIFKHIVSESCQIRKLDISGCEQFTPEQYICEHIEYALQQCPKLERLHLRKVGLRDYGLTRVIEGVTKSPNMKYLDVAANKLSRDAAKIVTPCTRTLETIDLSNNNIDNEGGVTLAKNLIKSGCTIHTLGLTSCNIEDRGLVALLDAFEKCESIKCIFLWGNLFEKESSKAITRLQQEGILKEENTDCRADQSWSEDGAYRPAQLSHSLQTYYWWQPKLGPQARLAQYQQPGMF